MSRLKDFEKRILIGSEIKTRSRISEVKFRVSGNGANYIKLVCGDKHFSIQGVYWFRPDEVFQEDEVFLADIVAVPAEFYDNINLKISSITRVKEPIIDFLEEAKDHHSNVANLEGLLSLMAKGSYGKVGRVTEKVIREVYESFITHPASKKGHHSYRGGLLEHSLETVELATEEYDKGSIQADINEIVSGALLHDIGKIYTLGIDTSNGQLFHTENGKYLNHSICGVTLLQEVLEGESVDENIVRRLQHIIASHHGDVTRGALINPVTNEAIIVNIADSISGRYGTYNKSVDRVSIRNQNLT